MACGAAMVLAIRWLQASSGALALPPLQIAGAGAVGVTAYSVAWIGFALLTLDL